jgi:hypothetical protein
MAPPSGSLAAAVKVTGAPVRGLELLELRNTLGANPRPVTVIWIVAGAEV